MKRLGCSILAIIGVCASGADGVRVQPVHAATATFDNILIEQP